MRALGVAAAQLHTATCQRRSSCSTCMALTAPPSESQQAASATASSSMEVRCRAADLRQAFSEGMQACRPRLQLLGCSNPRCTNLSGPSAEGLVAGCKGVRCGGCRVARYCSPACQKEDWAKHRHVCRRLAAVTGLLEKRAS
jgi:hypothetical protein